MGKSSNVQYKAVRSNRHTKGVTDFLENRDHIVTKYALSNTDP